MAVELVLDIIENMVEAGKDIPVEVMHALAYADEQESSNEDTCLKTDLDIVTQRYDEVLGDFANLAFEHRDLEEKIEVLEEDLFGKKKTVKNLEDQVFALKNTKGRLPIYALRYMLKTVANGMHMSPEDVPITQDVDYIMDNIINNNYSGRPINAIKKIREITGAGLKECKQLADELDAIYGKNVAMTGDGHGI